MTDRIERIVIVGGGPAGLATARAYRRAGGQAEVTIVAGEPHLPYRRPPLTKGYLRGEVGREELPIEEESWFAENDVRLRRGQRAERLDRDLRAVVVGSDLLPYDACVLATGSRPVRPPLPGADHPRVLVMRDIGHSDDLAARGRGTVVVVGSGFIGCEAAASLALRGAGVTMVSTEELPQLARLGREAGERIAAWLADLGIALIGSAEVEGFVPAKGGIAVRIAGGRVVTGDVALLATGARPRLELAARSGLRLAGGAIATDAQMRTSAPGILAVGDVAFAENTAAGRPLRVEHWGEALNHGEVAGRALAGESARWDAVPGFWSTIGAHTLKHVAWGDGWDEARMDAGEDGFAIRYGRAGVTVGVLSHQRDDDHARGRGLVERAEPLG